MMDIWTSLAGMIEVELSSAEPDAALCMAVSEEISVFRIEYVSELCIRFQIYRKDLTRLRAFCEQRGESLRVIRHRGLYWIGRRGLNRPVLLIGCLLFLALILYLPTRVFFVQVEGNLSIPDREILAAAENTGIRFGASRRAVRSEKMKNALLEAVPELQWAGVNTSGCTAIISVREKTDHMEKENKHGVGHIVAIRDGILFSCTVTRGTALVNVGQAVREGQTLISGYTDCGICIQATQAEGEVFAGTNRELRAIMPAQRVLRGEVCNTKRAYSLLIGKKRINLWKDSGISDASCDRMYKEYYITLPGGFRLPFGLCVERYCVYETETADISQEDAENILKDFGSAYLSEQMIAGTILRRSESVYYQDGLFCLDGDYVCTEMIGRVQQE